MPSFLQDLRFSLRLLARTPAFTVAAIAVLALGIGANTAIFSLVHQLIWSPRPFAEPDQIVQLYSQDKKNPQNFRLFSYPTYRDLAAQNEVFTDVLAHNLAMVGIGEGAGARRSFAALVSSNYFSVLGVALPQGRAFTPEEERPSSNIPVVIASHLYWKHTGFDPALVGKTIRVNERLFTVVGITPEHFSGTMMLLGAELYFPLGMYDSLAGDFMKGHSDRTLERRDANQLFLLGRLKPGLTVATAQASLQMLATSLEQSYPAEQKDQTLLVGALPRNSTSVAPQRENQLTVIGMLLVGMAGIVLLIACLNLANLLLARGHARRKEFAIRLALGGGRRRLVRQLLTEGLVLALLGGAAGLVLAIWGNGLLLNSVASKMPLALFFEDSVQPAVLAATLGFCALAVFGFALGPALRLTRTTTIDDLKEQAGEDPATHRRRLRWLPRHPLVVAQLALSLGLLCTAALFVRGALKAGSIETGFKADETLLVEVDAALGGYDQTRALQAYRAVNERLAALPGVQAASIGTVVPFGMISLGKDVRRAGLRPEPGAHPATAAEGRSYSANWTSVGAGYFSAMGLPLLRGRSFSATETDAPGAPLVAVIDENLARQLYPDGEALGQRIEFGRGDIEPPSASEQPAGDARTPKTMEIVGIVPATRWDLFDAAEAGAVYVPFAQGFQSNAFFHVRAATASPEARLALVDAIRREIRAAAPAVPSFTARTFRQHLEASLQLWVVRTGATLFGLFGALALVLAAVGIYGVKSYAVTRRTREIGIRVALGAAPATVRWMILREGLVTTLAGLACGLLLALALGAACAGILYQVSAVDPFAFTFAPLVLALAALLACWLPARRATRVSPMTALRTE
ncbi:ADOP family duplicated permease [Opitutus terrae]|uniref:Permease n=1 Tax=Opitutus terrae (strain DSM 11246 / JCM 15787 / PB90-1) TaxID=452637 RepID=B1ZWI9_OPITP|nr:ADOP family duplicated permease [Opitutus terrae]ACB73313.1 permease [Opitutus terrae PB90-1]